MAGIELCLTEIAVCLFLSNDSQAHHLLSWDSQHHLRFRHGLRPWCCGVVTEFPAIFCRTRVVLNVVRFSWTAVVTRFVVVVTLCLSGAFSFVGISLGRPLLIESAAFYVTLLNQDIPRAFCEL